MPLVASDEHLTCTVPPTMTGSGPASRPEIVGKDLPNDSGFRNAVAHEARAVLTRAIVMGANDCYALASFAELAADLVNGHSDAVDAS